MTSRRRRRVVFYRIFVNETYRLCFRSAFEHDVSTTRHAFATRGSHAISVHDGLTGRYVYSSSGTGNAIRSCPHARHKGYGVHVARVSSPKAFLSKTSTCFEKRIFTKSVRRPDDAPRITRCTREQPSRDDLNRERILYEDCWKVDE